MQDPLLDRPIQEPDNDATRVVRRLRAVNAYLKNGTPLPPDLAAELGERVAPPPPVEGGPIVRSAAVRGDAPAEEPSKDRDQLRLDWYRQTGQWLDDNGEPMEVPEHIKEDHPTVTPWEGPKPMLSNRVEEDVLGFNKPRLPEGNASGFTKLQGINLEKGVVVVDGRTYPISTDERAAVAKFIIDVVAREIGKGLTELAAANGIKLGGQDANEDLPEVPADATAGAVPPQTRQSRRKKGAMQRVQEQERQPASEADGGGKGSEVSK